MGHPAFDVVQRSWSTTNKKSLLGLGLMALGKNLHLDRLPTSRDYHVHIMLRVNSSCSAVALGQEPYGHIILSRGTYSCAFARDCLAGGESTPAAKRGREKYV